VFPRSCNKPLQAAGMLRAGLELADRELALVCASHSGTPMQVALARSILQGAGLDETALRNAPGLPLDEDALRAHLVAGGAADSLHQNCSGKHAGMLATSVRNGWSLDDYREPTHPLQRVIKEVVEELAGATVAVVGVDGCGAPLFALSLTALARAFARLVTSTPGSAPHRVAAVMREHPEVVGGPARVVTRLMTGVPGLLAKDGAEGAFVAALPDGGVVAVKIADGASRAAAPVLVAGLRALGAHTPALDEIATSPVLGGGAVVGEVRAVHGLCEATHTG
jgi:L-asparaginase II